MLRALVGLLVFSLSFSPIARAADEPQQRQLSVPEYMSLFTGQVNNAVSPIFNPEQNGGTGTGLIANVFTNSQGEQVIHMFTNKHVIDAPPGQISMQNLSVTFHSDSANREIPAKLVMRSDLHDFSVLEIPVKALVENQIPFMIAPLPLAQHDPAKEGAGAEQLNQLEKAILMSPTFFPPIKDWTTIAVGNPLGSHNSITRGSINTFQVNPLEGPFIQTQTPINPGNSGGPLIAELGPGQYLVVGINTLLRMGAQNMGFAIPIGVLMQEYMNWLRGYLKKDSTVSRTKDYVAFDILSPDRMQTYGYNDRLKKVIPNFTGGTFLTVAKTTGQSPYRLNDILLTINGHHVSTQYEYKREFTFNNYKEKQSIPVEVFRDGKVINLNIPAAPLELARARNEYNFAYLSGFVFQELTSKAVTKQRLPFKGRVYVSDVIVTPEMRFAPFLKMIPQGSVIQSIDVDGVNYEIVTLLDLKVALRKANPNSELLVHYYLAQRVQTDEQQARQAPPAYVYMDVLSHIRITNPEIHTPSDLSLHAIRKNVNLDQTVEDGSRNWRNYIRKSKEKKQCDQALAEAVLAGTDKK